MVNIIKRYKTSDKITAGRKIGSLAGISIYAQRYSKLWHNKPCYTAMVK